ncbi:Heavy-metal-associated domain and membrane-bounded cytochrome biogenesis cycZ-like domain, membrane copper tolerance protein [Oxalobacteraceae bacterium IMCC9480]|nr:Heavy-metal-associated domain and membrane-bounded cytochrome biogenesis cycZ-like domain, membrane copper tolerance protein [Oxalobacteraceae bacterium IMCC9480]NDP60553.1 sulfite exporter TauE/SafE family protein [Oxalobacteraceae bacterium]
MTALSLLPFFVIGLLGSVHCVGMCGGIVAALSVAPAARPFPVAVMAAVPADRLLRVLSYNAGRIGSYAIAGAVMGGVANGARMLTGVSTFQLVGYWLANLMLVALGLYLTGAWQGLARIESLGQALWKHIEPLTRRLLPLDSPLKMFAMGGLWGWLPCGMVYSVLLTAMLTGSALSGASVMLAFGLGTLPTLLVMGLLGTQLRAVMQRRGVRIASGVLVLAFGLLGLWRASHGMPGSWLDAICITPIVS